MRDGGRGRLTSLATRRDREGRDVLVSAIVLAAGRGRRMGTQKLLLPLGGRQVLQWVVDAALGARVIETIVVVGHDADAVSASLGERAVRVVTNPSYGEGMSTSLAAGVRAARADSEAAIFLLGDQPFVTSDLVDRLVAGFAESGAWIVRPELGGRPIHPVLISAALFPEILEQRGDVGGREVVRRHPDRQVTVAIEEHRVALDIDTFEDLDAAVRYLGVDDGSLQDPVPGGDDAGWGD